MENQFVKLITEKPELKEKLRSAKNVEEAYQLIAEHIPGYTKDQLEEDLKKIAPKTEELPDDQLEAVAGGVSMEDIYVSDADFFDFLFSIFGLFD